MASSSPPTVVVDNTTIYSILLIAGLFLIAIGFYLRHSYLHGDSLRTEKVTVPINSISKYDIEYRSNRFGTKSQFVNNVSPANIKSIGDIYSFYDVNNNLTLQLPIATVFKTIAAIQVKINDELVEIEKKYFTGTIEEKDVGTKTIDIEYEPGNMKTNISMVTEGLTSSESQTVYGLIIAGAILILILILKLRGTI